MHDASISALRETVRGPVFAPGDEGYDEARAVYNGMHDRRPAVVIRAVDVADVRAGVALAREQGVDLAVRGGGHSVPGFGTCDDGVVLDLSGMRWVHVDPEARTARAGGGTTWGDFNHAANAFGLATTRRHHLDYGHRRPDAGRWHRLPRPRRRALLRQPALG